MINSKRLEDYQVLIQKDTETPVSQKKMKPDLSDIRFSDKKGNILPYWIESSDFLKRNEPKDYIASWNFDEGSGDVAARVGFGIGGG